MLSFAYLYAERYASHLNIFRISAITMIRFALFHADYG